MAVNPWRLIPLLAASGTHQMAIDRWLLDQHYRGHHPPTLRFYTWSPIAISLGYHQQQWPIAWETLTWQGQAVDLVRRPTGGRAVLHQGDLTYAVVVGSHDLRCDDNRDRCQAYCYLCEFLIRGWQTLGVELAYGTAGRGYHQHTNCFDLATAADLVLANGHKFIGSAQLRRGQSLLQHGSIRLNPDPALWTTVFGQPVRIASPGENRPDSFATPKAYRPAWQWPPESLSPGVSVAPDVPAVPPIQRDIETIVAALCQAASDWFGIALQPQPLTATEWAAIASHTHASVKGNP